MRVLIAPDSFKGSLSALAAAECMQNGVLRVFPDAFCDLVPMADGGEGTVAALVRASDGTLREERVRGPLGKSVAASWGLFGDRKTAVVEMAAASGLPLIGGHERDPRIATTYGTGEIIRAALRALHGRCPRPRLIVGIGGSATNDGGAGCMQALGARFLDAQGRELPPGGAALAGLERIDLSGLDPLLERTEILVACDVDNPLCGPRGASAVFGPQKGASPAVAAELDAALARYAEIARRETGRDAARHPGAGAAGGLGAAFLFFSGARLMPGVEIVLTATEFAGRAALADLVLTGEGRTDFQTAYGKAPVGVAKCAKTQGKPVICISGGLGEGASDILPLGVDALEGTVCSAMDLEDCLRDAPGMLTDAAERVCRAVRVGMELGGKGR